MQAQGFTLILRQRMRTSLDHYAENRLRGISLCGRFPTIDRFAFDVHSRIELTLVSSAALDGPVVSHLDIQERAELFVLSKIMHFR